MRYEVACLGRKGVYLWEGSQYQEYFSSMHSSGMAEIYLASTPGAQAAFLDRVTTLIAAPTLPIVPQSRAQVLVDGLGAFRVAEAVQQLQKIS